MLSDDDEKAYRLYKEWHDAADPLPHETAHVYKHLNVQAKIECRTSQRLHRLGGAVIVGRVDAQARYSPQIMVRRTA